jgi:hypothetical protein
MKQYEPIVERTMISNMELVTNLLFFIDAKMPLITEAPGANRYYTKSLDGNCV